MFKRITLCCLFYGHYVEQAERCLSSIAREVVKRPDYVREFRLACNTPSKELKRVVTEFADRLYLHCRIPSSVVFTDTELKYPTMRLLFHHLTSCSQLGDYIMWFDDDSYFEDLPATWWDELSDQMQIHDMVGQFWLMPIQGNQWEWVQTQPWFDESKGMPPKRHRQTRCFEFCQGAWWVARSRLMLDYDWPIPELRHNGGDSMLGELIRQQGLSMGRFHGGVRINADERGRHSKAKRRGLSEKRIGWDYAGKPLDTSHQQFNYQVIRVDAKRDIPQF
jgi:hypothetical protein